MKERGGESMVEETIKTIKETEMEAEKIIKEAAQESAEILEKAAASAGELRQQAETDAKAKADADMKAAKEIGEKTISLWLK